MLLVIGGLIVLIFAATAAWLLQRAKAEPAARAVGRAPDPAEERHAERSAVENPGGHEG
jgi:hypothetical protein